MAILAGLKNKKLMPRQCAVTGKKTASGNNRNFSMKSSKRSFGINIQTKTVTVNGKTARMKVSAKGIKILKKRAKMA